MNMILSKLSYMELFAYERVSVNEISHNRVGCEDAHPSSLHLRALNGNIAQVKRG